MSTTCATGSSGGGNGVTGGYTGNSFTLRAVITSFTAVACYNAVELNALVFATFKRYSGLYFWSLLIASWGVIPHAMGFVFKYFQIISNDLISIAIVTLGWYCMVTGQSVVLYSRLHLVLRNEKILKPILWMIMIDAVILHIPTTVLTFGSNGTIHQSTFVRGYNIMEKIQMTGFCIQEFIISALYLWETTKILKTSKHKETRKTMYQLFYINVIIIVMDLGLLGLEYASLYILETSIKAVIYSVKLKLEFAILGKLVQFVNQAATVDTSSVSEFVDISQSRSDMMHVPYTGQARSLSMPTRLDLDDTVDPRSKNEEIRRQESYIARRHTKKTEQENSEWLGNEDDIEKMMRRYSVL
jgi:hypothetical protein